MDGKESSQKAPPADTTMPPLELAQALSDQPWEHIGEGEGAIRATSNEAEMINQLVSILLLRLEVLMNTRKYKLSPGAVIEMIKSGCGSRSTIVGTDVESELHLFVSRIASMYRDVGYHALEHGVHVTISLNKIVSLIVEHDREEEKTHGTSQLEKSARPSMARFRSSSMFSVTNNEEDINHLTTTFGIGRDALTQFALVFAGLIHDVDHTGLPNRQLVKEGDELAVMYNDRSVAEQHSLYIAFATLLEPEFGELRHVIFPIAKEKRRFRKIVIDLVLCTDIASPERMQVGKSKWKEAFEVPHANLNLSNDMMKSQYFRRAQSVRYLALSVRNMGDNQNYQRRLGIKRAIDLNGSTIELYSQSIEGDIELKASAVLERLIHSADVAHTMQSWETLIKWNKRLYDEQWQAFIAGKGDDPSTGWYRNQIAFYDFYILPLAKKLIECKVFGRYGEDFHYCAQENRRRWMLEGNAICELLKDIYENGASKDIREEDLIAMARKYMFCSTRVK